MFYWIYGVISLITLIILLFDKTISSTLLTSYIFGDEFSKTNKLEILIWNTIISPITLYYIIKVKIKEKQLPNIKLSNIMKLLKIVVIVALSIFSLYWVTSNEVKYYNASVNIQFSYNQKMNERVTILDRVTKITHQILQVAKINDTSYYKNLYIVATSKADNSQLFMKWVQENNPNANYNEVSALYSEVNNAISKYRDELLLVETQLQDYDKQYSILQEEVPSKFFLFYRKNSLGYIPISTDASKVTNKTGVDNNINL